MITLEQFSNLLSYSFASRMTTGLATFDNDFIPDAEA